MYYVLGTTYISRGFSAYYLLECLPRYLPLGTYLLLHHTAEQQNTEQLQQQRGEMTEQCMQLTPHAPHLMAPLLLPSPYSGLKRVTLTHALDETIWMTEVEF